ncbi:hypothetical protein [Falsibacillus pallidus]|uniref:Uncharacterized protein n=1 Tax=Falsibacillus pallidus TaxID=493781 RepID=A0A370GSM8_9BACI|nr:hypothetical protein [Falsibacillus pallidus]RDI45524.1 hypothetical protein DFR59_102152 [Falsibacillus pallidus]
MAWFISFVSSVLVFAFLVDRKRKKIRNNPDKLTHPHAKAGDDQNFMMGDNKHNNGGGF